MPPLLLFFSGHFSGADLMQLHHWMMKSDSNMQNWVAGAVLARYGIFKKIMWAAVIELGGGGLL